MNANPANEGKFIPQRIPPLSAQGKTAIVKVKFHIIVAWSPKRGMKTVNKNGLGFCGKKFIEPVPA